MFKLYIDIYFRYDFLSFMYIYLSVGFAADVTDEGLDAGVEGHVAVQLVLPVEALVALDRKFMSCNHRQELGQLADLASNSLFTLV